MATKYLSSSSSSLSHFWIVLTLDVLFIRGCVRVRFPSFSTHTLTPFCHSLTVSRTIEKYPMSTICLLESLVVSLSCVSLPVLYFSNVLTVVWFIFFLLLSALSASFVLIYFIFILFLLVLLFPFQSLSFAHSFILLLLLPPFFRLILSNFFSSLAFLYCSCSTHDSFSCSLFSILHIK